MGLLWKYQGIDKTNFHVGLTLAHFNHPNISLSSNNSIQLPLVISFHFQAEAQISKRNSFLPNFLVRSNDSNYIVYVGFSEKFYFDSKGKNKYIQLGVNAHVISYHFAHAKINTFIFNSKFSVNHIMVGVSYNKQQFDVSDFTSITYELYLGYTF